VDVYVNYLRKKLGPAGMNDDGGHAVIETVRGEGYRMSSRVVAMAKKEPRRAAIYAAGAALAGA